MNDVKRHYGIKPERIQVDNGSEFISKEFDRWAYENNVTLDYSRPGKPTDNAFIESFNGSFRDECLNVHWFLSLEDAAEKIEAWSTPSDFTTPAIFARFHIARRVSGYAILKDTSLSFHSFRQEEKIQVRNSKT